MSVEKRGFVAIRHDVCHGAVRMYNIIVLSIKKKKKNVQKGTHKRRKLREILRGKKKKTTIRSAGDVVLFCHVNRRARGRRIILTSDPVC